jgi:hypothetical protein
MSARHYSGGDSSDDVGGAATTQLGQNVLDNASLPYHCVPTVVIDGEVRLPNGAQVGYAETLCAEQQLLSSGTILTLFAVA